MLTSARAEEGLARHLDEEAPSMPLSEAAMIAAGPWLFTVIALGLIGRLGVALVPVAAIDGFTLLLVNVFALSMIGAAPVTLVAVRAAGDALHAGRPDEVPGLLVSGLIAAAVVSAAMAAAALSRFAPLSGEALVVAVAGAAVASWLWVALGFAGAIRDHTAATQAFLTGLALAVLGALAAMLASDRLEGILLAVVAGLACIFVRITRRLLSRLPAIRESAGRSLAVLAREMRRRWPLALAGLVGSAALWIDKWLIWAGPEGQTTLQGLPHAPAYDSAVFTASLALIPGLALLVTHLEGAFYRRYSAFYRAIEGHQTLDRIEAEASALQHETLTAIARLVVTQAALAAIVIAAAPAIVTLAGLQFRQVPILRFAAIGTVFHFLFVAATSVLLYFDRQRAFAALQLLFAATLAAGTLASIALGPLYYGTGYLAACLISGLAAFAVLEHTLRNLTFITFVVANNGRS